MANPRARDHRLKFIRTTSDQPRRIDLVMKWQLIAAMASDAAGAVQCGAEFHQTIPRRLGN
jgi:hypothetical protein